MPSSPLGLLTSEGHARTRRPCDQVRFLIGNIAINQSDCATLFDDTAHGE